MLEELMKAIRGVVNNPNSKDSEDLARAEESWQNFLTEFNKIGEEDLKNCKGLDSKSIPIFVALEAESSKVIEFLLNKYPWMANILNDKGQPPIFGINDYIAATVVKMLFDATSESLIIGKDKDGNNILHIQVGSIGNDQTFQMSCAELPQLANQQNNNGQTPLHLTYNSKKMECLLQIMSPEAICAQATSEDPKYNGNTVLHNVALGENVDCVKALLIYALRYCPQLIGTENFAGKTAAEITGSKIVKAIINNKMNEIAAQDPKVKTEEIINLEENSSKYRNKDLDLAGQTEDANSENY